MKATKWQIALIIVVALILIVSFSGCTAGKGKVAVIRLNGTISDSSQLGLLTSGGISPKLVGDYLMKAESDTGVKAVVLRIDSPGGSAAALANTIYNAVGVRIKDLPITPEKVLKVLEEKREGR